MDSTSLIIWGMLFGAFGLGFLAYGKKQRKVVPFLAGIALIVMPYFIVNIYFLVIAGIAVMILPYFVRM